MASPIVRTIVAEGPLSIRDLAAAVGVTHSAASQTVAQLQRAGFVTLRPGSDARQRIVHLTGKTRELLPTIEAEWKASDLGRTAKFYGLTREGRKQLTRELESWQRLSTAVGLVIQDA